MAFIHVSGNIGFSELTYTEHGTAILRIAIADNRWNYREEKEETEWIRVAWFGERAEKLSHSILKAKTISVIGKESYKLYEGKIDRKIEPLEFTILSFKKEEENERASQQESPSDYDIPFL